MRDESFSEKLTDKNDCYIAGVEKAPAKKAAAPKKAAAKKEISNQ